MAPSIPNIKLNSGYEMPQVGFGLWKVTNETCADQVYNAIKTGYRLFDGACDYGNEVEAGQGVARALKDGLVKREELFLVSKIWNTYHEKEQVEPICRKQLADWGIDYFDLYYMHFPVALKYVDPKVRYPPGWEYDGKTEIIPSHATIQETWHAMEELVEKKLTRSIAISNFQGVLVLDMLRYAKIRPAVLQIEHHPYLVQEELVKLAKSEGIAVTAYSTFGPSSFVELGWTKANIPPLFKHETITKIADKHKKTPAQVMLRWATQRGLCVIPKSNSQHRLEENLHAVDWDLEDADIQEISGLDRHLRFNNPPDYLNTLYIFA